MDWTRAFSDVLPPLMHDPVTFAIPFFLLLLIIEWAAARKLAHTEAERAPAGAYLTGKYQGEWAGEAPGGACGAGSGCGDVGFGVYAAGSRVTR